MQADIITILIITISIDKLLVLSNTTTSKTVTLWILYMKTIEISLQFLRGRCTGDWQQHLDMNHMTLWYFASLSHYDYQKSMYLHLQTMSQIHVTHPGLPKHFMNVLHVIRTTDRFCASHSLDLVMQEDLMHSLKTFGGLTRGRGTKICSEIPSSKNLLCKSVDWVLYNTSCY